ncbi:conserved unknown protein [Ectocarpus siliculosus]|uniref:Uncharacterized protein n=1 Tax=Ectocarpus siliculosus TaxID=2880 RepID=D7G6V3_ECTSI|nr:conserved unknown protein [Ectocarpus siliculosus]|eukprot:CBJ25646.1 conserved unknown protein [Ectocarpus siliculosus]
MGNVTGRQVPGPASDMPLRGRHRQEANATASTTRAPASEMAPSGRHQQVAKDSTHRAPASDNRKATKATPSTARAPASDAALAGQQETNATASTTRAQASEMAPSGRHQQVAKESTPRVRASDTPERRRHQNATTLSTARAPASDAALPAAQREAVAVEEPMPRLFSTTINRLRVLCGHRREDEAKVNTSTTRAPASDAARSEQEAPPAIATTTRGQASDMALSGHEQEAHATSSTARAPAGDTALPGHRQDHATSSTTRAPASDTLLPGDRREAKFAEAMALLRICGKKKKAVRLLQEYKEEVDRELSGAMVARLNNPGHDAVDLDQPIFNLEKLKEVTANVMDDSLNEWIARVNEWGDKTGGSRAGGGITPQAVLPRLFWECSDEVETRYRVVEDVLRVVDKMKMHENMCNHHKDLFHLMPREDCNVAIQRILRGVRSYLADHSFDPDDIQWLVTGSGLDSVALQYMVVMANVRLQYPPVTFSTTDCGKVQQFDPELHSDVGGGGVRPGQECTIVFPAIMTGEKRCTVGYTLTNIEAMEPRADASAHFNGTPRGESYSEQDYPGEDGSYYRYY